MQSLWYIGQLSSIFVGLIIYLFSMNAVEQNFLPSDGVLDIAWNPNPDSNIAIAIVTRHGNIQLFDHQQTLIRELEGNAYRIAWNPQGDMLISSSVNADFDYTIWDATTGLVVNAFNLSQASADASLNDYSAYWTMDGQAVVVLGVFFAELHDAETTQVLSVFGNSNDSNLQTGDIIDASSWDANNGLLYLAKANQMIEVWNESNGEVQTQFQTASYVEVTELSPNGSFLAVVTSDRRIRLYDTQTFAILRSLEFPVQTNNILQLAWSPDNQLLVGVDAPSQRLIIWDIHSGEVIQMLPNTQSEAVVSTLEFSPFGGQIFWGYSTVIRDISSEINFGSISSVILNPSLERFQAIAAACGAEQLVGESVTDAALPAVITDLQTMTDEQIPPACAADLLAIAQALQNDR
jgi:WD40 repeat protein